VTQFLYLFFVKCFCVRKEDDQILQKTDERDFLLPEVSIFILFAVSRTRVKLISQSITINVYYLSMKPFKIAFMHTGVW